MSPFLREPPPERLPACPDPLLPEALAAFEQGHALPLASDGPAVALIFRDVEEHVDGNGVCALWLLEGSGLLTHEGGELLLSPGDVAVFDDRLEHAFASASLEPCLALNLTLGLDAGAPIDPLDLRERLRQLARGPLLAPNDPAGRPARAAAP